MADQGQWFKLWISAEDDQVLGNFSLEDFGRWCKFGLYLKKHGTGGKIELNPPCLPLQHKFQVSSFHDVLHVLHKFPNCDVTGETECNVTWRNWNRYQVEESSTYRVRKWRERKRQEVQNVTEQKRRDEKRRDEKRIEDNTSPSAKEDKWPSPHLLIKLYNEITCGDFSAVEKITDGRLKKSRAYLHQFPQESFWREVFEEMNKSLFLRGQVKPNGHGAFRADFDWLLTKGKDGTENAAKVFEGKYRNG